MLKAFVTVASVGQERQEPCLNEFTLSSQQVESVNRWRQIVSFALLKGSFSYTIVSVK